MKKDEERIDILRKKAEYFHSKNISVHVTLKDSNFLNGDIIESSSPDFFLLEEFKEGELPVFYIEIFDIKKYKENKEGENEPNKPRIEPNRATKNEPNRATDEPRI
ncbi:MAG: hypothetical protein QXO70_01030 [Candidatus Pacearchaeota archaeon]